MIQYKIVTLTYSGVEVVIIAIVNWLNNECHDFFSSK